MKKLLPILFLIFCVYKALAQTEVYIAPLPFFSGFQARVSAYGFKNTNNSTKEVARFEPQIFNASIIKNNKYKYSFSIGSMYLAGIDFRINRKYLVSTSPNAELSYNRKNYRIYAKTPQIECAISKLYTLPNNYYLGLGLNATAFYISKYPPVIYMVEHEAYDSIYRFGDYVKDKKMGSLEQLVFTRRNHFNFGLGPSVQFGKQIQRIRIETFANLIFKSPEFYDVEHTIFPTNEEKIRTFNARHAQFPTAIYQLGLTFSYKIIEL